MTPDPRDSLSLLLAGILAMGTVVGVLFHRLVGLFEARLKEQAAQHTEALKALQREYDLRYEAMRDDRDFHRQQGAERQQMLMLTLTAVKETVVWLKDAWDRDEHPRRGR